MNFSLRFLLYCFCCFGLFIATSFAQQNGMIEGSVKSTNGEALPGATIQLSPTTIGSITDGNGHFSIKAPTGNYTLEIRSLGYEIYTQAISITTNKTTEIEVFLAENSTEMNAVEVIGKSEARKIAELPFSVASISTKELFNTTADAMQILNRVSGVRIQEEGGLGSNSVFTLNGFSGDQVKFFLDGIPMDHFGSSFSLSNLPVNYIKRIEVYKGVVPVWLGADALGGAVNIITKNEGKYIDASYTIGSFNTHKASINGAYTDPETGFMISGNVIYNYSKNNYKILAEIVENNNPVDTTEVERFHDAYQSGTVQLETGLVNKSYADKLLVGLIASADEKEVQNGSTMSIPYGGIMNLSNSIIPSVKYKKENLLTKGLNATLNSAWTISETKIIDTLSGVSYNWLGEATVTANSTDGELVRTYTIMDDKEFLYQLNLTYELDEHHSWAINNSYSQLNREVTDKEDPDKIENQFPKSLAKSITGVSYNFHPNSKWSSSVFGKFFYINAKTSKQFDFGLPTQRTEALESDQHSFGYGATSAYFITKEIQIKGSYEHTLRMPWADEIFGDGLFVDSNPDLKPEKSNNLNLGLAYRSRITKDHRFNIESSFIYRKIDDQIYQVVKVASPITNYANLYKTRTIGVEGSIGYQWKKYLQLDANVTFQDITDQADSVYNESYTQSGWQKNYQKGFRIPNKPYFFANAHVGFTLDDVIQKQTRLQVDYRVSFVEQFFLSWAELGSTDNKKVIPRQTAHNLQVSYSIKEGKYNIALECRNLTDARLYDKYYLQKPGRAFYLKLRYSLGQ